MQVILSTRHFEPTGRITELVEERFARLDRFEPRVSRAEVALLQEKNRFEVQATASVNGAGVLHARAEASDLRTAVDRAVEKLGRQLRRLHSRRRDHQATPREGILSEEPGA